jgi:hypothetical protein
VIWDLFNYPLAMKHCNGKSNLNGAFFRWKHHHFHAFSNHVIMTPGANSPPNCPKARISQVPHKGNGIPGIGMPGMFIGGICPGPPCMPSGASGEGCEGPKYPRKADEIWMKFHGV